MNIYVHVQIYIYVHIFFVIVNHILNYMLVLGWLRWACQPRCKGKYDHSPMSICANMGKFANVAQRREAL